MERKGASELGLLYFVNIHCENGETHLMADAIPHLLLSRPQLNDAYST